jgi:hypothetical protein
VSLVGTAGLDVLLDSQALDVTSFARRFTWRESMLSGGFSWTIHLTTDAWREWSDVVLGRTTIGLRLKTQEGDIQASTDWRTAYIDRSSAAFRSTTATYQIDGADVRLDLMQKARTRAWASRAVSDIVQQIAGEYGLDATVERTTSRRDRWQCRETDWDFMRRLAAEAASESGRGDCYVWHDGKNLRFDAPHTQARSDRRHVLAEVENRVDRTVVSYQGREVDRMGGATLIGVGYDMEAGGAKVFTLNADKASAHPALGHAVPRVQADGLCVVELPEAQDGTVEELVRGRWGKAASRYFALRLDARPDLALRPGMIVDVQGDLSATQQTPLLGRFAVLEVQHTLVAGALTTTVAGYRREAGEGDEEPTGAAAANVGTRDRYRFGAEQRPRTVIVAEVIE